MFYPFQSEDELLTGNPPILQNTLACPSVLSAVNKNRQKFEPYAGIAEEAFANFNHNLKSNQDSYGQIENDETEDTSFGDKNKNASDANTNEYSSVPFNALSNQSEKSIAANIRSLNVKQSHMFNVAHKWARDHVKGLSAKNKLKPQPFHISLSGSGGTGKFHVIKTIFQTLTKKLLYHSNNSDKIRVLLLAPTGISAVNIKGATIHSCLGIISYGKYNKLGHKLKAYLRNKLSELKVIIIDEISMVSSELFYQVHSRLIDIFDCKADEPFAGIPIIVNGDLYQLPPVKRVPIHLLKNNRLETLGSYNL